MAIVCGAFVTVSNICTMIRMVLITNIDFLKLFLRLYFQKGIRQSSSIDVYGIILPVYQNLCEICLL